MGRLNSPNYFNSLKASPSKVKEVIPIIILENPLSMRGTTTVAANKVLTIPKTVPITTEKTTDKSHALR